MQTWKEKMDERLAELELRVDQEREELSAFRKSEAIDLALTPDETKEFAELRGILAKLDRR